MKSMTIFATVAAVAVIGAMAIGQAQPGKASAKRAVDFTGYSAAGEWKAQGGFAPRTEAEVTLHGVSEWDFEDGYVQIKYTNPAGQNVYLSAPQWGMTSFWTSAGSSYAKIWCRWGQPGAYARLMSCDDFGD